MAMGAASVLVLALCGLMALAARADEAWEEAHATFYGDASAGEAREGSCGYDTFTEGYGKDTTALSTALYSGGQACGSCYEMKCFNSTQWCKPGTINITATNLCPPNPSLPSESGGWCNPPRKHFDLTLPAFLKIGEYKAGIIPIQYRRVPCIKQGGVKFLMWPKGSPNWTAVLVFNVAGAGDVNAMSIKGTKTNWIAMTRNWGQLWQTGENLVGQSLSFRVTTSDGKMIESVDVSPPSWAFGQTFEGNQF